MRRGEGDRNGGAVLEHFGRGPADGQLAGRPVPSPTNARSPALRERGSSGARRVRASLRRREAEAAVAVAGDLVDELDLPGEIFAHVPLALGGALAGRHGNVVAGAGGRPHAAVRRHLPSLPPPPPPR